jgi:hypothetical protein
MEPPLVNRSNDSPAEEELDGLLRAFFRDELPQPWPALTLPAAAVLPLSPTSSTRPGGLSRSRVALAASVALLFGGQAWLHDSYQEDEPSQLNSDSSPADLMAGKKPPRRSATPGAATELGPRSLPSKPMR